MPKLKLDKSGHSLCGGSGSKGCGCQLTGVGRVIRGFNYCRKCYKRIKNSRKPIKVFIDLPGGRQSGASSPQLQ